MPWHFGDFGGAKSCPDLEDYPCVGRHTMWLNILLYGSPESSAFFFKQFDAILVAYRSDYLLAAVSLDSLNLVAVSTYIYRIFYHSDIQGLENHP